MEICSKCFRPSCAVPCLKCFRRSLLWHDLETLSPDTATYCHPSIRLWYCSYTHQNYRIAFRKPYTLQLQIMEICGKTPKDTWYERFSTTSLIVCYLTIRKHLWENLANVLAWIEGVVTHDNVLHPNNLCVEHMIAADSISHQCLAWTCHGYGFLCKCIKSSIIVCCLWCFHVCGNETCDRRKRWML